MVEDIHPQIQKDTWTKKNHEDYQKGIANFVRVEQYAGIENTRSMEKLHGWVFTYNSVAQKWEAVTRDNYFDLFNGGSKLSSSSIETLIEIIIKTEGNQEKLDELTKKK